MKRSEAKSNERKQETERESRKPKAQATDIDWLEPALCGGIVEKEEEEEVAEGE